MSNLWLPEGAKDWEHMQMTQDKPTTKPSQFNGMTYKCHQCGGIYEAGRMNCLVIHTDGRCCHKYDKPAAVAV